MIGLDWIGFDFFFFCRQSPILPVQSAIPPMAVDASGVYLIAVAVLGLSDLPRSSNAHKKSTLSFLGFLGVCTRSACRILSSCHHAACTLPNDGGINVDKAPKTTKTRRYRVKLPRKSWFGRFGCKQQLSCGGLSSCFKTKL